MDKLIEYFKNTPREKLLRYKYPYDLSGYEWDVMNEFVKILNKLNNQMGVSNESKTDNR